MATEVPRLLFVHAHPDDESINNGATIAHYAARGATVHVVTCTLGEEGEVIGDHWAQLAVDHADQLGGYRIGELTRGAAPAGHRRADLPRRRRTLARLRNGWYSIGFADRSGSSTPTRGGRRRAGRDHPRPAPARRRHLRPQRRVRPSRPHSRPRGHHGRRGRRPVPTADPAEPWAVPKFYWTVIARSAFDGRRRDAPADDLLPDWELPSAASTESASTTIRSPPVSTPPTRCPPRSTRSTPMPPRWSSARRGGPARCRTTWRCPSSVTSTTSWCPVSPGRTVDEFGWETDLLAGLEL